MCHLGARSFEEISGEIVQTVAWIMISTVENYRGTYSRLVDLNSQSEKEKAYLKKKFRVVSNQKIYFEIPGMPVAYWISKEMQRLFHEGEKITKYVASRDGLTTGNNELFIRQFWEVEFGKIGFGFSSADSFWKSKKKYVPLIKGGLYRKWYGNNWFVIGYDRAGYEKLSTCGNKLPSREIYFYPYITWNRISTRMAFRYCEAGYLFESASLIAFATQRKNLMFALSFANTKVSQSEMALINPTTNMLSGYIDSLCIPSFDKHDKCIELAELCVEKSKNDWDSFETSWDFTRHPFIKAITKYPNMMDIGNIYLAECYDIWAGECEERFTQLKANEEELNRIFIDIYGLQDELTPEVEDKDVTVRKADLSRDVRSFISYAVGCMFGRYSPTYDGLAYAGGTWDDGKYNIYKPDADGIIPICDDEYFEDDMMGRFVEFVRVVYGDSSLEDNLRFIANALGGKGQPKEVIRNYFLNDFYTDHCKIYQKRPIYWLFDSGKKNGFKCLIYLHRYQPDTIARIRTDYVHEQQARYRTAIEGLEKQVAAATSTSERVKLTKQLNKVQAQDNELHQYEEKVHALADQMIKIDLDDGVKHNYEIFKDVLAKIK